MKSIKRSALLAVCCVILGFGRSGSGDVLNVGISPAGNGTFLEDVAVSGHVTWLSEEGLSISAANYDIHVMFAVGFTFTDPDNIPLNPSVCELSLLGWPTEFGDTISWSFWHVSSMLDGPLNSWEWRAEVVIAPEDTRPVFLPGQSIATVEWSTGGIDLDDVADDSSFRMTARASIVLAVSDNWLMSQSASDAKLLNPEPVPEPAALLVLPLGGMMLLSRRKRRNVS